MGNSMPNLMPEGQTGPMRLYVGSLHFNTTEDMLRGIFEPFGKIYNIQLIMDPETGRSKGYGFLTYYQNADDLKKALEQLNGFELAGRPMKVGNITERTDLIQGPSLLDTDELDRSGIDLGATGRLQLMFKLAEVTGLEIPQAAANALNIAPAISAPQPPPQAALSIATQCFMLSNIDPSKDEKIVEFAIEEASFRGTLEGKSERNVPRYDEFRLHQTKRCTAVVLPKPSTSSSTAGGNVSLVSYETTSSDSET